MTEHYTSPQITPAPMNPYHLNQLGVSSRTEITTIPVSPPAVMAPPIIVAPPATVVSQESTTILQQLHSSPDASIHGPPMELASPCDMPPVTESIMERRKRLSILKFKFRNVQI
jgi:hypothetical protein